MLKYLKTVLFCHLDFLSLRSKKIFFGRSQKSCWSFIFQTRSSKIFAILNVCVATHLLMRNCSFAKKKVCTYTKVFFLCFSKVGWKIPSFFAPFGVFNFFFKEHWTFDESNNLLKKIKMICHAFFSFMENVIYGDRRVHWNSSRFQTLVLSMMSSWCVEDF